MLIVFLSLLMFGLLLEWLLYKRRTSKREEDLGTRRIQQALLLSMSLLSISLCLLLNEQMEETKGFAKFLGLFFLTQGVSLRLWSYHVVRTNSERYFPLLHERPLYSHGPYKYHRHPFHTSFFLITLGSGLYISGHWLSVPITFILLGSALHTVMKYDEALLENKYGEIYTYWSKRRFRILPFVY